ncbi:MAG: beta-propeller domain-containing protein, partial [Acutalibacteraceae bacterium]|nr:beta-propeller domain-containing protein [Acutalibacteraceae bacterium]
MKREDKDNAEYIRDKLKPVDEKINLPDELSAENITALVSGKEQKKSKKGKMIAFKAVGSVAAAIIIAIGIGTVVKQPPTTAKDQASDIITQNETHTGSNSKQTIIDYFTVLKEQYKNNYHLYGEIVYNSAVDGVVPESGITKDDASADMNTSANGTSSSHGTTNVQVQGIDEDDIIKNDGKHI